MLFLGYLSSSVIVLVKGKIENIVAGEIACFEHILLLLQCFQKLFYPRNNVKQMLTGTTMSDCVSVLYTRFVEQTNSSAF